MFPRKEGSGEEKEKDKNIPSGKTELPPFQKSFSAVGFSGYTQWDITPTSPTSLASIVSTTSPDLMNRGSILQPRTAQLPRLDSGPLPSESISAPSTQSSTSAPGPSSTYRSLQGPESSSISVPLAGPAPSSLSGPTTPSAGQFRLGERSSEVAAADEQGTPAKTAKEGSFKCEFCPSVYPNERILRNHLNNVHPVEMKNCRLCNFSTIREEELNAHMAQQHPVLLTDSPDASARKWKCREPSCRSSFHTRLNLIKHKPTHFIYKCRGCTTKYKKQEQLDYHNQIFHRSNEEILHFLCLHCHNHFQDLKTLKEHVEYVIESENPKQCPICGHNKPENHSLKIHYYLIGDKHYDKTEFKRRHDKGDANDGGSNISTTSADSLSQGSVQPSITEPLPGISAESMFALSRLLPISEPVLSSTSASLVGPAPPSLSGPSPSAGQSLLGKRRNEVAAADEQGTPAKTAKEGSFKCEFCPAVYPNERILRNHLNNVHQVKKSGHCNFSTRREEELHAHMAQQHMIHQHPAPLIRGPAPAKKWDCSENSCRSSFITEPDLLKHEPIHFNYECQGCTTKYKKQKQLHYHNQIFHSSNQEILDFICLHCDNHFQDLKTFKEHVEYAIENEDPRQCPICGLLQPKNYKLKLHYYAIGDKHYDETEFKRRQQRHDKDDDKDGGRGGGSSNVLQVNYVFIDQVHEALNFRNLKKSRMIEFFICKKCYKAFETKWWLRKHCLYFCEAKSHTCL